MTGAAMAQAVRRRPFHARSGSGRLQSRFGDPFGYPASGGPGRKRFPWSPSEHFLAWSSMRDRAEGVHEFGMRRHHTVLPSLPVADRDRWLGAGELQIAPFQIKSFRLAQGGAPEQQPKQPGLSGRHGVQDQLDLVRCPVVGKSSRGHGASLTRQTSVQSLPSLGQVDAAQISGGAVP